MTIFTLALIPYFFVQLFPITNVTGEKVQDDTEQVVKWAEEKGLMVDSINIEENLKEKDFAEILVAYFGMASSTEANPYSVLATFEVPLVGYNTVQPSFQEEEIPVGLLAQSLSYLLGQGSSLSDAHEFFDKSISQNDFRQKATVKDVLSVLFELDGEGKNQLAIQKKTNPFGQTYQEMVAFSKVDPISYGVNLSSFSNYNSEEAEVPKDTDLQVEDAINLMSGFANIYMNYEVDDYYRITTYDSKKEFEEAFRDVSNPSMTSRYLDYLVEEKDGELYVIPTEFPPLYMDGFDTHLYKLDDQHYVSIQTVFDEMVGSYQIVHEFEWQDGKWLISDLYGQPNPLLKNKQNMF